MKVLLLKTIKGLGEAGKIIEAKAGYIINYLLPKKLATTDLSAKVEAKKPRLSEKEIATALKKIKKLRLNFEKKANDKGVLFSGVNERDIQLEIQDRLALSFPLHVELSEHLKNAGEYSVPVSVEGQKTQVKVNVLGLK